MWNATKDLVNRATPAMERPQLSDWSALCVALDATRSMAVQQEMKRALSTVELLRLRPLQLQRW